MGLCPVKKQFVVAYEEDLNVEIVNEEVVEGVVEEITEDN